MTEPTPNPQPDLPATGAQAEHTLVRLLAELRTLERSFRAKAGYNRSMYRRYDDHGRMLMCIHVGMCADDVRDLLRRYASRKTQ